MSNISGSYTPESVNAVLSARSDNDFVSRVEKTDGGQRYCCTLCDKKYRQSKSLRNHMRLHTGERPYFCDLCDLTFTYAAGVNKHKRVVHFGIKPHTCASCQKNFSDVNSLRRHEKVHKDVRDKPHECPICSERFTESSSVKEHLAIHTGDNPYVCDFCHRGFMKIIIIIIINFYSPVSNTRCHSIGHKMRIARIKIRVDSPGRWERA